MLVLGAGGLAAQLFDDLVATNIRDVVFWSEVDTKYGFIKDHYQMISSDEEVIQYFKQHSNKFLLCIGNNKSTTVRKQLSARFKSMGGIIETYLSPYSRISPYGTQFGQGTIILNQVNIEPGVILGNECIVNKTGNIGHGCIIGANCEIGPGAILTGEVEMGSDCIVGTGAIILPKLKIGSNSIIAAGAVVTKNIPDNAIASGVPAKIIHRK